MQASGGSFVSTAAPPRYESLPHALLHLDAPSRAVLDLAFRHGMSPDEIAVVSGIERDAVVELRDAALTRLAADIGLAGAADAAKVRAMLAGPAVQAASQNGAAPARAQPRSWRWLLFAGAAAAVILAIVLPLTLAGGHRAAAAHHRVASRAPAAPQAPAPPPQPTAPTAAPIAQPRPTAMLQRVPGSPRTAHATARLTPGRHALTLTAGGLPRPGPRSYVVLLYNSPRDALQIGRFPGGSVTLRLALPGNYRRFRSLRIMRNRWWRQVHPRRSVLIAPVKALG